MNLPIIPPLKAQAKPYHHRLERMARLKPRGNRIIRYYSNIDMRCAHNGLKEIAKKDRIYLSLLKPGEFVVFLNSRQTVMKIYTAGETIVHVKVPQGRINPGVISLIPHFFNGKRFDYNAALTHKLKKDFPTYFNH